MAPRKRTLGGVAAAASEKKKAKLSAQDPVFARCQQLEAELFAAPGLPEVVRQLLTISVRNSLGVPRAVRHPCQEAVANLIAEALSGVEDAAREALLNAQSASADASAAAASGGLAVTHAEAVLAERRGNVQHKQAALEAAEAALVAARTGERQAKDAEAVGTREFNALAKRLAASEESLRALFAPLRDGAVPGGGEELKRLVAKLDAWCQSLEVDSVLISSASAALLKGPTQRGAFETMAVTQLEADLNERLERLRAEVQGLEPSTLDLAGRVQAAQDAVHGAQAEATAAREALRTAQHEEAAAVQMVTEAESVLATLQAQAASATSNVAKAEAELQRLRSGPLAALEALRGDAEKEGDGDAPGPALHDAPGAAASDQAPPSASSV